MKKILSLILSAAVASTGISPLTRAQETTEEANWVLAWSDEFEGDSLDMTKWSYELGNWLLDNKGNYETSGWGNNEQEFYTDKNALVENGTLTIQAKKETYTDAVQGTYEYTSSKLVTQNKFSMCLGKVEIRARVD
jgi:beta-glucanase (GH16 family)